MFSCIYSVQPLKERQGCLLLKAVLDAAARCHPKPTKGFDQIQEHSIDYLGQSRDR